MSKNPSFAANMAHSESHIDWGISVFAALVMKFFFDKYNFTSGGAIAALTLGLVIKELWLRGWPAFGAMEGKPPFCKWLSSPLQRLCHTLQAPQKLCPLNDRAEALYPACLTSSS